VTREIKNELKEWRSKKEELIGKEARDRIAKEEAEKKELKKIQEADRLAKKELVEEFKFRREMQKHRDK